jgi:hypothetical protein
MATPTGTTAAARQAASGFALRALPRRKTYTTSWDINGEPRFQCLWRVPSRPRCQCTPLLAPWPAVAQGDPVIDTPRTVPKMPSSTKKRPPGAAAISSSPALFRPRASAGARHSNPGDQVGTMRPCRARALQRKGRDRLGTRVRRRDAPGTENSDHEMHASA